MLCFCWGAEFVAHRLTDSELTGETNCAAVNQPIHHSTPTFYTAVRNTSVECVVYTSFSLVCYILLTPLWSKNCWLESSTKYCRTQKSEKPSNNVDLFSFIQCEAVESESCQYFQYGYDNDDNPMVTPEFKCTGSWILMILERTNIQQFDCSEVCKKV